MNHFVKSPEVESISVTSEKVELPIHYAELESIYSQTIDRGVRSLAITSCHGSEGVTTLACALAKRALAGGHKTLLVDMNFCRPALARELDIEEKPWQDLEGFMSSEIAYPDQTHAVSSPADVVPSGLAVLPAPVTPTGNLMLREKHFLSACLQAWLKAFDVVIIDTSPVNAINRHNLPAERIAAECDGVLLTVRSGVTRQAELSMAMERLSGMGVQLSGCVFNDINSPTLGDEIIRETYRLQRWLPGLMGRIRRWVRESPVLNMSV